MATSAVPAAMDALFAGLKAALPNVQVLDGPAVGVALRVDHVIIGGDLEDDAATGSQRAASLGAQSREETFDITVQAASYVGGGSTQKLVRDRAYALVAAVEMWLRANPTLVDPAEPPVVRYAEIGSRLTLDQRPPTDVNDAGDVVVVGRKAVVTFTVACSVRI